MAKEITETISKKIDTVNFHVTARNFNRHIFSFMAGAKAIDVCLDTDEMRELGEFLISAAKQIDADPDFNKK